jgi:hypothetical protein
MTGTCTRCVLRAARLALPCCCATAALRSAAAKPRDCVHVALLREAAAQLASGHQAAARSACVAVVIHHGLPLSVMLCGQTRSPDCTRFPDGAAAVRRCAQTPPPQLLLAVRAPPRFATHLARRKGDIPRLAAAPAPAKPPRNLRTLWPARQRRLLSARLLPLIDLAQRTRGWPPLRCYRSEGHNAGLTCDARRSFARAPARRPPQCAR